VSLLAAYRRGPASPRAGPDHSVRSGRRMARKLDPALIPRYLRAAGPVRESGDRITRGEARLLARQHGPGWPQRFRHRSGRWSNRPAPRLPSASVTPQEQARRLASERVVMPEEQAAQRRRPEWPVKRIPHRTESFRRGRTQKLTGGARVRGPSDRGDPAHDQRQAAHHERQDGRVRLWNVHARIGQHHHRDEHRTPQKWSHASTFARVAGRGLYTRAQPWAASLPPPVDAPPRTNRHDRAQRDRASGSGAP
jgi:hypothetical protein